MCSLTIKELIVSAKEFNSRKCTWHFDITSTERGHFSVAMQSRLQSLTTPFRQCHCAAGRRSFSCIIHYSKSALIILAANYVLNNIFQRFFFLSHSCSHCHNIGSLPSSPFRKKKNSLCITSSFFLRLLTNLLAAQDLQEA